MLIKRKIVFFKKKISEDKEYKKNLQNVQDIQNDSHILDIFMNFGYLAQAY